jgi:hypothetical protein
VSLSDDLLPILDDAWTLVSDLGFSPNSVIVRTRTWDGGEVQLGTPTVTDLQLQPNPPTKELNGDKLLLVGPITPTHPTGGYSYAQLRPSDVAGVEYYYIVSGNNGANRYTLKSIDSSESFETMIVLEALERRLPF